MSHPHEVQGAPAIMKKRGLLTDGQIYDYIRKNQNSTIREIAENLNMTNGRVDSSVNRLLQMDKVLVNHFIRNGILVKRVSTQEISSYNYNQIEITKDLLEKKIWKEEVYVYALSRSAIGISPYERENWKKRAPMQDKLFVKFIDNNMIMDLPEYFVNFYELPNSQLDISGNKDQILLSVQATIIPVDLPSEHPINDEQFIIRGKMGVEWEIIGVRSSVTTAEHNPRSRSDIRSVRALISELNKIKTGKGNS